MAAAKYRCAECGEEFELDSTEPVVHTEDDFMGCGPLIRVDEGGVADGD